MSATDCMPIGLVYDGGLTNCPTSSKLLWSLGIFNAWSAILSIFFGHDSIRRRIPSCSCSKEWRPFSPALMSLLHPVAMVISTITIRANGFSPNILLVFAIWTMRPRMIAAPIWYMLSSCSSRPTNPYLWTFKDNVIEETLLNIFSLPFALWFIKNRNDSEQGACAYNHKYQEFWDAFYIVAAAGAVSLILLICMTLHFCSKIRKAPYTTGLSRFWKWTLTVSGLNMLLAFAGQWLLWSAFITNAGTDFCPGSLLGESVAWGVTLLTIALGRPLVGGPL